MKKLWIILLACVFSCASHIHHALADNVIVGANLVNQPQKQSVAEQEVTFDALQAAGVHVIRAGIPANDLGFDFAKRAYAHGIKIVWLMGIYPKPGTQWPKPPRPSWPLSAADADTFRDKAGPFLAKLESEGIELAGFEMGNEINWSNYDLSGTGGRVLTLDDLSHDPEGQQVARGFLQYLKTLAVLKDIRDHSKLNRHTPIISAGLADLDDSTKWLQTVKADAVSVAATLDFLRANGLDNLVDVYGLHFYPPAEDPRTAKGASDLRLHLEHNGLQKCQPPGSASGKPCWITEWNFNGVKGLDRCPIDDFSRIAMVGEMRSIFDELIKQGRLRGALFYTWQGNIHAPQEDHYSAFLCGSLTESGRLALAPM